MIFFIFSYHVFFVPQGKETRQGARGAVEEAAGSRNQPPAATGVVCFLAPVRLCQTVATILLLLLLYTTTTTTNKCPLVHHLFF